MDSDYKNGTKFSRGFEQKGKSRGLLKVNKKVGFFFFLLSFSKTKIKHIKATIQSKLTNLLALTSSSFHALLSPNKEKTRFFWLFMARSSRGVASEKTQTLLLLNWVFSFVSTERQESRREEIFGVWKNCPMERDELSICALCPRESDDQTSNRGEKTTDLSLSLYLAFANS
ncbi:LOW QUALITY PROTEIN: hypothetical protein TorRG33x02_080510 [Trema orientale]|uniref:Uncharacterized protein n=1 Tax=Trema orientale TaxID=63057 RepID=A0A2P5FE82_TREOI|nr:LOW QUALITY PROTEIN: hypothetical protein TorRG33x02_080510 [Trema orientale]